MANNNLAKMIKQAKQTAFEDGLWQGINFGVNVAALAYYNSLGIGRKRCDRAQAEAQRIVDEIINVNDPDWTAARLEEAVKKIK